MAAEHPGNDRANIMSPAVQNQMASSVSITEQQTSTNYTIPGILHFIKHEWSRFEKERANWDVERAELQAKIAFLQGERKGHENLMHDLVRRIKMLEYALKQERAKLYKLQHGKEMGFSDLKSPSLEPSGSTQNIRDVSSFSAQKEESRKILRDYLREVGFPDNVLEARVSRISAYKSLYVQTQPAADQLATSLRANSPKSSAASFPPQTVGHLPMLLPNGPIINGTDMELQHSSGGPVYPQQRETPLTHPIEPSEPMVENTSGGDDDGDVESALNSYGFLNDQEEDSDDDDDDDDDDDESGGWVQTGFIQVTPHGDNSISNTTPDLDLDLTESASDDFEVGGPLFPDESEENSSKEEWRKADFTEQVMKYTQHKPKKTKDVTSRPSRSELQRMEQFMSQTENPSLQNNSQTSADSMFGSRRMPGRRGRGPDLGLVPGGVTGETIKASMLGDLAVIDIANSPHENPSAGTVKKWEDKYTMRSHFDAVTSLAFHPTDQVLVTGSDDWTLKMWNLQKASPTTRNNRIVDVEPLQTFRGHTGAVLSVAVGIDGKACFSGSVDSSIRVWQMPLESSDPFDPFDPNLHCGVLQGHTDAVWDLSIQQCSGLLLSCAADGTCKLWNHQLSTPLINSFQTEPRFGNPTSTDFISTDSHQMVASYSAAKTVIFDLETGQSVLNLDCSSTYDGTSNTQINQVACHPTLPILATAHEDKYIRFYDKNTGKVTHSMTAHPDAVSCLTFDPHGLYLLSGGHDGSLRFWTLDSKTCVQVILAHRKRYDESVYSVCCHLSLPYFASAGADSIAKVFE